MEWMRERDALIAQTLAFVQSVTGGNAGEPPPAVVPDPAPPADVPPPAFSPTAEAPQSPSPAPRPVVPGDFQREIKTRVANFRAHQERFNREREEYSSATLARLRASMKDSPPPGPRK